MASVEKPGRDELWARLEALPPNVKGEIIDGELHTQPRARFRYMRATGFLGRHLGGGFDYDEDGPGGWWILDEPELHLGADVVVPDLAGWRRERLPEVPDEPFLDVVPDWICEILSPSTQRIDRVVKLRIYARAGVPVLWLVDPVAHTLEVLAARDAVWVLVGTYADAEVVHAVPFEAAAFDLSRWW